MHRRSLVTLLLVLVALPLSASQFVERPFDSVARESALVIRGTVGQTWSAWDDAHEVIYTYATVRVNRYFGEATGPDTLIIREAGGTVDGYKMEAIGFPELRSGEDVVLLLSRWQDSADYRIHAFNQGKFLVRNRDGVDVLIQDPLKQGESRLSGRFGRIGVNATDDEGPSLTIDEFSQMVNDARAGHEVDIQKRR